MCGITGIIEKRDNSDLIKKMCASIAHRGPDGVSTYQVGPFTMGHLRLSVIDLNTGDQPIYNEDKTLSITFNGEIYNYKTIRENLIKRGHKLYTQTDTETILHLFEDYGTKAFAELNGIYSFTLCDHKNSELYLVKDHFGVKPLHYYIDKEKILYGSEIKAILADDRIPRKLNYNALHQQLNLRYNQSSETLFKNIFKLEPAHYLHIKSDLSFSKHKYYSLEPKVNNNLSENEACEKIRFYLKQAVERQMVSDVPLGLYLSGGIDSGSLVAFAAELSNKPIKTFTLGFNEATDEFAEARLVSDRYKTEHLEINMSPQPLDLMEKVIFHAEEPKINLIQGYMMSEKISEHVTVALSGLGGDELFAGYDIFGYIKKMAPILNNTPKMAESLLLNPLSKLVYFSGESIGNLELDERRRGLEMLLSSGNMSKYYLILRNVWDFNQSFYKHIYHPRILNKNLTKIDESFSPFFTNNDVLAETLFTEFNTKMVNDYLLTEDRMSMANSIEQRVPFLDKDLVEFAFSIPTVLKFKGKESKYLLRKAMKDYLPEKNLNKKKWGFTFNPYLQFQKDLKQKALTILTKERIEKDQLFNYAYIEKIIHAKPSPHLRWHYNYLWLLIGFYIWKDTFNVELD